MAREEAIEILKRMKQSVIDFHDNSWLKKKASKDILKAYDMAIKALEQEPCWDAISRQAAIDAIENTKSAKSEDGEIYVAKINAEMNIQRLPSVSTEKTGHWSRKIKVDAYDLYGVKTWGIKCQCDRCTFTTTVVEDFGYYKYCPNCGAKMWEEGE